MNTILDSVFVDLCGPYIDTFHKRPRTCDFEPRPCDRQQHVTLTSLWGSPSFTIATQDVSSKRDFPPLSGRNTLLPSSSSILQYKNVLKTVSDFPCHE